MTDLDSKIIAERNRLFEELKVYFNRKLCNPTVNYN